MEKDLATPLLIGIGSLATATAMIDYRKAKIEVGEGVTRLIAGVKETDIGDEEGIFDKEKPGSSLDFCMDNSWMTI
ncbi:hypothetical protein Tco_1020672 [Tanacetum coccineum]